MSTEPLQPEPDIDLAELPIFAEPDGSPTQPARPALTAVPAQPRRAAAATQVAPLPADLADQPGWTMSPTALAPTIDPSELDWALVAAFRSEASARLTEQLSARGGTFTAIDQHEQGRQIINQLLDAAAQEAFSQGRSAWPIGHQDKMAVAIFDALFRLGRLQPLVDDPSVENIEIRGDRVIIEHADSTIEERPPVAENDAELIGFLAFLASRSEANARPFSQAQPRLHLRLDGGARLAATAWVTPHPVVVIRRHRLQHVTLEGLVERDMFSPNLATFLRAAIRAQLSIVIAGPQGAGKTTVTRALCACLDPDESIGTFETEYELHLHEMKDRHRRVVAFEARPGSGERGWDGRQAGEITLDDLLYDSFRFNLSRQIVGEVRGREILAMIKAMQSGTGSLSTTHAKNARAAIGKLITCALEAGAHVTQSYAERAISEGIDLVVQVDADLVRDPDGSTRRVRYVSEVVVVEMTGDGVKFTDIYKLAPGTRTAVPHVLPDHLRQLQSHGFDLSGYLASTGRVDLHPVDTEGPR